MCRLYVLGYASLYLISSLLSVRAEFSQSQEDAPKIQFVRIGNSWQNITSEGVSSGLYAADGDDLFLECEAPFPIQWSVTGLIKPLEVMKIQETRRDLLKNTFRIGLYNFFYASDGYPVMAVSANIICERIGNSQIRDQLSVFVKSDQPFVTPESTSLIDSKLIPCATTNPTTPTSLYLRNSDGSESLVRDVNYYPTEGFRSEKIFNGVYTCRKENFSLTVMALASSLVDSDHQFSPSSGSIKVFSDEVIEIKCSSKTKPIHLNISESSNTTTAFTVDSLQEKVVLLSVLDGTYSGKGKISCISDGTELVREWVYEFVELPELYLDNYSGELHCLSNGTPKSAQSLSCSNSIECNLLSTCLRNSSMCNFDSQIQFSSEKESFCWIRDLKTAKACVNLPFYHLNGMVQCTVSELTRRWEFFISLDYQRYKNWRDAPERELVRMDDVPEVIYTNETTQFICMASAYLFADSVTFEIEYKNGTRSILQSNTDTVKVSTISSENPRKIRDLNVGSLLEINLPIDATAVHCLAPWWNSTDVMQTFRKFQTI